MRFEVVERDFIARSLALLDQYDQFVMPCVPQREQYETTLLINCLMGLVVVPFETKKRAQGGKTKFPKICNGDEVPIQDLGTEWGLTKLQIQRFVVDGQRVRPSEINLRKVVAMFRHAIAHSRFRDGYGHPMPQGLSVHYTDTGGDTTDTTKQIESIILEVNLVNTYSNVDFHCSIPVKGLRLFVVRLAHTILTERWPEYCLAHGIGQPLGGNAMQNPK